MLAKVKCPVLAVNGDSISGSSAAEPARDRKSPGDAGNSRITIKEFKGLKAIRMNVYMHIKKKYLNKTILNPQLPKNL